MSTVQECAQKARIYLSLARLYPRHGLTHRYYRNQAKQALNEGKQLRSIKRQSELWGALFGSVFGARRP